LLGPYCVTHSVCSSQYSIWLSPLQSIGSFDVRLDASHIHYLGHS
jgi:hypothetical protein